MLNIGAGEIALILVVALLILGPRRLPELARGIGKFLAEFRRQTDEVRSVVEREFYRMDRELEKMTSLEPGATSAPPSVVAPVPHNALPTGEGLDGEHGPHDHDPAHHGHEHGDDAHHGHDGHDPYHAGEHGDDPAHHAAHTLASDADAPALSNLPAKKPERAAALADLSDDRTQANHAPHRGPPAEEESTHPNHPRSPPPEAEKTPPRAAKAAGKPRPS